MNDLIGKQIDVTQLFNRWTEQNVTKGIYRHRSSDHPIIRSSDRSYHVHLINYCVSVCIVKYADYIRVLPSGTSTPIDVVSLVIAFSRFCGPDWTVDQLMVVVPTLLGHLFVNARTRASGLTKNKGINSLWTKHNNRRREDSKSAKDHPIDGAPTAKKPPLYYVVVVCIDYVLVSLRQCQRKVARRSMTRMWIMMMLMRKKANHLKDQSIVVMSILKASC